MFFVYVQHFFVAASKSRVIPQRGHDVSYLEAIFYAHYFVGRDCFLCRFGGNKSNGLYPLESFEYFGNGMGDGLFNRI